MKLSSLQLEAFAETAKVLGFSKAAHNLCITQSALSQRIQKLEERLEAPLFLRGTKGIRLTTLGEQLLKYCINQSALEEEFLKHAPATQQHNLVGSIRIAGFSTVMESLIVPALATLVREHPLLSVELHSLEIRELLPALESGLVDLIITNEEIHKSSINSRLIGQETNVLIQSATLPTSPDTFLDHDKEDTITMRFWKKQSQSPESWRTFYLDDIHMIINGVKQGLGRAIVPVHLIKDDTEITVSNEFIPLKTPVYTACYKNESQTQLHKTLWQIVTKIVIN